MDRTGCTAPRHGDDNAYSKDRCRCPDAREAWRRYAYARRHGLHQPRLVDPAPTVTRLRILAGVGYDWRTLARLLNYRSPKAVTEIAFQTKVRMLQRRTATRVRDLYNQLIVLPPPYGYAAGRATNNAQRAGWGVVDLEVVHRALAGKRPKGLTALERKAVIFTGAARGMTPSAIATAANTNHNTVAATLAA